MQNDDQWLVQTSECKLWIFTKQLVLDTMQLITIIINTNIYPRLDCGVARIFNRHNVFPFSENVLTAQPHHLENANQST